MAISPKEVITLMTAGLLLLNCSPGLAETWSDLRPAPLDPAGYSALYSLEGKDLPAARNDESTAFQAPAARKTPLPSLGFLDQAFTPKPHRGKVGRVIDALGLQAIYDEPLVRNLLGRVRGSRLCLSGGCGINLKMSLRKPGLRFEHAF